MLYVSAIHLHVFASRASFRVCLLHRLSTFMNSLPLFGMRRKFSGLTVWVFECVFLEQGSYFLQEVILLFLHIRFNTFPSRLVLSCAQQWLNGVKLLDVRMHSLLQVIAVPSTASRVKFKGTHRTNKGKRKCIIIIN